MAATNQESGSMVQFFKLKEDERTDSKTKGHMMFFKQAKVDGKWVETEAFNVLEGQLKDIRIKSYEYDGQTKENLEVELYDIDGSYVFSLGLRAMAAQNILNTLEGEKSIGILRFETGKPKEHNGKWYPTLYIKNNGEKTSWAFTKDSAIQPPKVTTEKDEDGNVIKRGQKKLDEFWKGVAEKIKNEKCIPQQGQPVNQRESVNETSTKAVAVNSEDLPF